MRKVLFIDRDGTIIVEPPVDKQVDSLEKLEFIPKAISNLRKIAEELDYELAMVTNQDGLGTPSLPEENFWPAHNKVIRTLEGENVRFTAVHIDRSFEEDNSPNRKPRTGMLKSYLEGDYDLANSYVIGDRITDLEMAKNLGCKAVYFSEEQSDMAEFCTSDWDEIYRKLKMPPRKAMVERITNETKIQISLNLDGSGKTSIRTGVGFFDHMLDQLGRHGGLDLDIAVDGDLHIDEHHTIEDTGLALGECFLKALGDKKGIGRYGFLLPMDDSLAQAAIDFGGRPWIVWNVDFKRERVGDMPTEMVFHFFKSFSDASKCNLNIKAEGDNEHHKIEAIFKGFAKSVKMAVARDIKNINELPSTKGVL